jgi:hypothetical protein
MQKTLSHPNLRHKVIPIFLLALITALREIQHAFLAIEHDIAIDMALVCAPVQRRNGHDERGIYVPFSGAQESEQQCVGMVMLDHAPEGFAQLFRGRCGERGAEVFADVVLLVSAHAVGYDI